MTAALIVIEIAAPQVSDDALSVLAAACTRAARDAECVLAKNASDQQPAAVAIVSLQSEDKMRVEVGVHQGDHDSWRTKDFSFLAADDALDRWRAIGFAIGTLAESDPPPDGKAASAAGAGQCDGSGGRGRIARRSPDPNGRSGAPRFGNPDRNPSRPDANPIRSGRRNRGQCRKRSRSRPRRQSRNRAGSSSAQGQGGRPAVDRRSGDLRSRAGPAGPGVWAVNCPRRWRYHACRCSSA